MRKIRPVPLTDEELAAIIPHPTDEQLAASWKALKAEYAATHEEELKALSRLPWTEKPETFEGPSFGFDAGGWRRGA